MCSQISVISFSKRKKKYYMAIFYLEYGTGLPLKSSLLTVLLRKLTRIKLIRI